MQKYSDEMEFEKAATVRNRLKSLGDFTAKQKVVSPELKDRDIFGIARNGDFACTLVFIVREGKLIGKRHFLISKASLESAEEILQRTLEKYYLETDFVPKEIILPNEIEDLEYLLDWLGKKQTNTITVQLPKIGDKRKLVEMANTNAEFLLKEFITSFEKRDKIIPHSLLSLQRDLNLTKPPRRIECFDNSHFQGSDMVSSMVVFIDGKPKKSEYRKFKAKDSFSDFSDEKNPDKENSTVKNFSTVAMDTVQYHNDDFAMMRETIERRFLRAIAEKEDLPDLVIVDGGKGQLSSAFSILEKLGLSQTVAIIGLAKRLEEVFKPNSSLPILLPKTSSSLKLLQQLRDEAHRFAITFHRQLRDKRAVKSELLEISGIGKITMKKLIEKFGSVKSIKEATDSELQEVLNLKQYNSLKEFFADKE
jgi:excinuclease ABC subunit C